MNYREAEGLNYSTLASIDSNYPAKAFEEGGERFSSDAMNRGSLVDCLLTSPDRLESDFIITPNQSGLSEAIIGIIKATYAANTINDELNETLVVSIARDREFGSKWSTEVLTKKVYNEDTKLLYRYLKLAEGKTPVSEQEYEQARQVVYVLRNHVFTRNLFVEEDEKEIKFQHEIYWEEDGLPCKGMLDMVIFDHKRKLIQPLDLKIKSDSKYSFTRSFLQFKYYLQAAWYSRGLKILYPDYQVLRFAFIVTSFDYPEPPLIYICSQATLDAGWKGGILKETGQTVKGALALLNDYKWYMQTGNYAYPREVYEKRGILSIDLFVPL